MKGYCRHCKRWWDKEDLLEAFYPGFAPPDVVDPEPDEYLCPDCLIVIDDWKEDKEEVLK